MERNILLKIEYDGTDFSGWQRQPGRRTVQGTLEEALSKVLGQDIKIEGTSRTDAGVHALGQRAIFKGEFPIPTENIQKAVNNMLAGGMNNKNKLPDINIAGVMVEAPDFHPRFDAKGKHYRYIIENSKTPNIFRRNYRYQINQWLDTDAMREAANQFLGEHDFAAFQSAGGTPRESTVRRIYSVDIYRRENDEIIVDIIGNGFLYNMIRIMVGTLVEVGLGKREPMEIDRILKSLDRSRAGHTAPPQGLYLMDVYYEFPEMEI